jgi:hypothetical protein
MGMRSEKDTVAPTADKVPLAVVQYWHKNRDSADDRR